jgi:cytochrome c-type biogenesis protein CcmH/NrfG
VAVIFIWTLLMTNEDQGGKCQGVLKNAVQRNEDTQMKLYFDKIIEVQSASFEHAVKSNTVNVTIIYAGAFLLIQNTASEVPRGDWSVIVLLLFVSLLSFALWSVLSSYRISRQTISASKLMMDPKKTIDRKLAEFEVLERKARENSLIYYATWGFVFSTTIITGFLGAIYLLVFYILNLLGLEFSLVEWIIGLFSGGNQIP